MSKLLLQLFDVTHLFGMHLRPELVLLQKTMVQVEGVARGLDPHHDMWSAARPIVERWVKRELGPEAVARRGIDEAAAGFAAMRRLPQTLAMIEAAARKVSAEAPREERKWFEMPVFWIGMLAGGVLALVLSAGNADRAPRQPAPTRAIETPGQPDAAPRPIVDPELDLQAPAEEEATTTEATP
jgi:predicted unusual protein kinase regulating ubiquinone biosynthesis (AarF/ABC1/UbiB family)